MRVAVAGLGRMGGAMAARLIEMRNEVHVWNRSPDKAAELVAAGAKLAASPAALAANADIIVTMLTNAASLAAVYEGPNGLLAGDVTGKIFVEMSTVQPHDEAALAEKVRAKGGRFVECPVGGTVGPARNGQLIGVVGAESDDFQAALPVLHQLCRRVDFVGPVGAAASLKLALNLPLLVYYQALGEAYTLVRHLGLDNKWLMEFLAETSGGPNMLKTRGPAIANALSGGDVSPVTFDIDLVLKDLRTILDEAKTRGVRMPVVEQTLAVYEGAAAAGWGKRDAATLPAYWPSTTAKG